MKMYTEVDNRLKVENKKQQKKTQQPINNQSKPKTLAEANGLSNNARILMEQSIL